MRKIKIKWPKMGNDKPSDRGRFLIRMAKSMGKSRAKRRINLI